MMDVHCPQCGTVFEFDERLMRGVSATLQCSVCQHVFTIRATHRQAEQENQPRWMVRSHDSGDIFYFRGFDTLHRWILERKVAQHDEISRTGRKWTGIADIGEFAPIFQVVESISQLTDPPKGKVPESVEATSPTPSAEIRDRQLTMQQFPNRSMYSTPTSSRPPSQSSQSTPSLMPSLDESSEGDLRATTEMQRTTREAAFAGVSPVPQENSGPIVAPSMAIAEPEPMSAALPPVTDAEQWSFGQSEPERPSYPTQSMVHVTEPLPTEPRKRTGLWVGLLLALLIGGVAYVAVFEQDRLKSLMGSSSTPSVVSNKPPKTKNTPKLVKVEKAPEWIVASTAAVHKSLSASEGVLREQILKGVEVSVTASKKGLHKAYKKASRSAEKQLMKSDIKLVLKKANKALRRKQAKRARALYHQALEIDSHNDKAIVGLGWSLLSMNNTAAAAAQFKKALHVNSLNEDAYIGLGKAERARGRLKAALSAYDNYLERFPTGKKASIARYQRKQLRAALGM